jgi:hypothetical protein
MVFALIGAASHVLVPASIRAAGTNARRRETLPISRIHSCEVFEYCHPPTAPSRAP